MKRTGIKILLSAMLTLMAAGTARLDAQNTMELTSSNVAAGSSVVVNVLLSHDTDANGFTTVVTFDNTILTLQSIDAGSDALTLVGPISTDGGIEFWTTTIDQTNGFGTATAIFDLNFPFDGQVLVAGTQQVISSYQFGTVNDPGLVGTCSTVSLTNNVGSPPLNNVITVNGGTSVLPTLTPGDICFVDLPTFIRSDANSDGISNVADAIFIVNYLFLQGAAPLCSDSVDANDDGLIDISDIVYIINYNFLNGFPPPAPFPGCGIDNTGDSLDCLNYTGC